MNNSLTSQEGLRTCCKEYHKISLQSNYFVVLFNSVVPIEIKKDRTIKCIVSTYTRRSSHDVIQGYHPYIFLKELRK
jgi:hypothetical protein